MSFTDEFSTTCRWQHLTDAGDANGIEHLHVNSCENNIIASSMVVGGEPGKFFGIHYTIICAPDWSVRAFTIENTNGQSLQMNCDGEGNWFGSNGSALRQFAGAIDVDFSGTPFTNTLPIRRMTNPLAGKSQRYKMLYISFQTLEATIDRQQYTCIIPYRKYRYESLARSYNVELEVDAHGIVVDYPLLFRRENLKELK